MAVLSWSVDTKQAAAEKEMGTAAWEKLFYCCAVAQMISGFVVPNYPPPHIFTITIIYWPQ